MNSAAHVPRSSAHLGDDSKQVGKVHACGYYCIIILQQTLNQRPVTAAYTVHTRVKPGRLFSGAGAGIISQTWKAGSYFSKAGMLLYKPSNVPCPRCTRALQAAA